MTDDLTPKLPIHETKDTLILSLKSFFSTHCEYKWSPNQEDSLLSITDAFPLEKDKKGKYPAIVVKRHEFGWRNGHLNQNAYNNMQDEESGIDLLRGSFSCLCVSSVGLEAERLAEIVFLFFTRYRKVISCKGLFDIQNPTLGSEQIQQFGSDTDIVVVPVRLQVQVEDSWTVIEGGPTLEDFTIRLETEI